MLLSKYANDIGFYFVQNVNGINTSYDINGHDFYVNGNENNVPGIYLKSMKAINYINNNFDYDYLIRTNISSIYNIPNIINYLEQKPKYKFATGFILSLPTYRDFLHGTSMIITKDVAQLIEKPHSYSLNIPDDVLISLIIKSHGISLEKINEYYVTFLIDDNYDENKVLSTYKDVLYYRVKNNGNRNIDIQYFDFIHRIS